jgi:glyoxylase-like metal-dependent hydrolase (beta-lactamase superfamily II)
VPNRKPVTQEANALMPSPGTSRPQERVLIDPGAGEEALRHVVASAGGVDVIINTHYHFDHIFYGEEGLVEWIRAVSSPASPDDPTPSELLKTQPGAPHSPPAGLARRGLIYPTRYHVDPWVRMWDAIGVRKHLERLGAELPALEVHHAPS